MFSKLLTSPTETVLLLSRQHSRIKISSLKFNTRELSYKRVFTSRALLGNTKTNSLSESFRCCLSSNVKEESSSKFKLRKTVLLVAGFAAVTLGYLLMRSEQFILAPNVQNTKSDENETLNEKIDTMRQEKFPDSSGKIPNEVKYLIIGGGAAGFAASRRIKSVDAKAEVLILAEETNFPYMKPPLSKELLMERGETGERYLFRQWNAVKRSVFYEEDEYFIPCEELKICENGGIAVARGWKATSVDPVKRIVTLEDGKTIKYEKCLLSTGSIPKKLKYFENLDDVQHKVTYYNSLSDFKRIESLISEGSKSITIFGGDILGCELAASLTQNGKNLDLNIMQIVPDSRILKNFVPDYLSDWLMEKMTKEGVTFSCNVEISDLKLLDDGKIEIQLSNGESVSTDHLLVCLGSEPNATLAKASGLEIDEIRGGYLVNAELELRSNLFAAGDCASFYDSNTGVRKRLSGYDYAIASGRIAGENMTGGGHPLTHISMFWSDLGTQMGFEAVGNISSDLKTVGYFADSSAKTIAAPVDSSGIKGNQLQPSTDLSKGVIFYLNNKVLEGMIFCNIHNRLSVARQILRRRTTDEELLEVVKLFNIHDD